jgi:peptidoglycan/xylan/chitin deacetylase (PgdA/CDA1 family)
MALDLIKAARVPVTLFLTTNWVSGHTDYFQALKDTGYVTIQNHTVSHPSLPEEGYDGARNQLCPASTRLEQWFGERPALFRPPFGNRDATTLQAAWDCGLKAGFHWRETVDSGNVYYQRDHGHIHAGDIILMHFRPAFPDDFIAALTAIHNSGLSVARLEDYVRVADVDPPGTTPPPPPAAHAAPPAIEPDRH